MSARLASAAVFLVVLSSCRGAAPAHERATDVGSGPTTTQSAQPTNLEPALRPFEVPAGWDTLAPSAFERAVDEGLPAGERRALSPAAWVELAAALDRAGGAAVRAAVLLGRSGDPRAAESLLARLERRVDGRHARDAGNAADVVAAAAFGILPRSPAIAARLEALACGERPHPDLEVRVECAASALRQGRDGAIDFLLRVLRGRTPAGLADADLGAPPDPTFAERRAAGALSGRAGIPCRFRPEASVRDREEEIARLATRLRPTAPAAPAPD